MIVPKNFYRLFLPKSLSKDDKAVETTDKTIAPKIAGKNPSIVIPGTTSVTNHKTTAFTTKVKSPKVKRLIGAVNTSNTGLINVLITPKTIAASIALVKSET